MVYAGLTIPNAADAFYGATQSGLDRKEVEAQEAARRGTGLLSGCEVTAQGTPDTTVAVAAGWVCHSWGPPIAVTAGNVAGFTAAAASMARVDLVVVNLSTGVLSRIAGTEVAPADPTAAAAGPVWPSSFDPDTYAVLAEVYRDSTTTTVITSHIVDKRTLLGPAGGMGPGSAWRDMATSLANHDPLAFPAGRAGVGDSATKGQFGAWSQIGLTDGVEVAIGWQRATSGSSGSLDDIGWQPGPAAFVSPSNATVSRTVTDGVTTISDETVTSATAAFTTADIGRTITGTGIPANSYIVAVNSATSVEVNAAATATGSSISLTISGRTTLGISPYWDITQSGTAPFFALWGLFDDPSYLAFSNYVQWDSNFLASATPGALPVWPGELKMRCVNGKVACYWKGERILGPIAIPAWASGRDGWGFNCIEAATIGNLFNAGDIPYVTVRPYSTDLGSYPAAPSPNKTTGTAVKATAVASVAVGYPDTPSAPAAGERIVAVVNSFNGTVDPPTGWRQIVSSAIASNNFRITVFEKTTVAGGETGTVTFSRTTGTSDMGGFMFTLPGANPQTVAITGSGQANTTASTSIRAPARFVSGSNRVVIWIGGRGQNIAITAPTGFTDIKELGTGATGVQNMKAAYKVYSTSPAANTKVGELDGSWASSLNSVGVSLAVLPDPR